MQKSVYSQEVMENFANQSLSNRISYFLFEQQQEIVKKHLQFNQAEDGEVDIAKFTHQLPMTTLGKLDDLITIFSICDFDLKNYPTVKQMALFHPYLLGKTMYEFLSRIDNDFNFQSDSNAMDKFLGRYSKYCQKLSLQANSQTVEAIRQILVQNLPDDDDELDSIDIVIYDMAQTIKQLSQASLAQIYVLNGGWELTYASEHNDIGAYDILVDIIYRQDCTNISNHNLVDLEKILNMWIERLASDDESY